MPIYSRQPKLWCYILVLKELKHWAYRTIHEQKQQIPKSRKVRKLDTNERTKRWLRKKSYFSFRRISYTWHKWVLKTSLKEEMLYVLTGDRGRTTGKILPVGDGKFSRGAAVDEGAGQQLTRSFWGKNHIWDAQRRGKSPSLKQSSFLEEVRKGGKRAFPEFLRRKMPDGTSPTLLGDQDRAATSQDEKAGDNPLHPPAEVSQCSKFSSDSCCFSKPGSRGEGMESNRGAAERFPTMFSSARRSSSRTGRCKQKRWNNIIETIILSVLMENGNTGEQSKTTWEEMASVPHIGFPCLCGTLFPNHWMCWRWEGWHGNPILNWNEQIYTLRAYFPDGEHEGFPKILPF